MQAMIDDDISCLIIAYLSVYMYMSINVFFVDIIDLLKILTVTLFDSYSVQYCLHYHTCSKRFTTDNLCHYWVKS